MTTYDDVPRKCGRGGNTVPEPLWTSANKRMFEIFRAFSAGADFEVPSGEFRVLVLRGRWRPKVLMRGPPRRPGRPSLRLCSSRSLSTPQRAFAGKRAPGSPQASHCGISTLMSRRRHDVGKPCPALRARTTRRRCEASASTSTSQCTELLQGGCGRYRLVVCGLEVGGL